MVGKPAPEFDVAAWATEDGQAPDLKGKVVLVDFWLAGAALVLPRSRT
jgi:hypothetical protein